MSNLIRDSILYENGVEFHIALDANKRFFCESLPLALQALRLLKDLGLNAVTGKETAIQSKMNGPIRVIPVYTKDIQSNALVIRVPNNLLLAYGIAELFKDPQVHHMGMKVIPLKNKRRRSGRRNHSTRR